MESPLAPQIRVPKSPCSSTSTIPNRSGAKPSSTDIYGTLDSASQSYVFTSPRPIDTIQIAFRWIDSLKQAEIAQFITDSLLQDSIARAIEDSLKKAKGDTTPIKVPEPAKIPNNVALPEVARDSMFQGECDVLDTTCLLREEAKNKARSCAERLNKPTVNYAEGELDSTNYANEHCITDTVAVPDSVKKNARPRFTLTGILTESNNPGITYTGVGINGAKVHDYFEEVCPLLEKQLAYYKPDLVIFAIGINDANVQHFNDKQFKDDYDKLIVIANKVFKSPYFFQCGYTEDKYPRGHAQLRKDGTAAILPGDICQSFHQGIFIDIFVYDAVPDKKEDLDTLYNNCLLIEKLKTYCYKPYSVYNIWKNYKLYKLRKDVDKIGFKNLFAQYDRYLKSYENSECKHVSLIGFIFDFEHYLRDKHVFDGTIYMPFEYIMMPVPIGYDEILTTQYGNYMKPVKAPAMHGGFTVLDTEKSYIDYLPQLRRHFYKEAWKKRFLHIIRFFHK